MAGCNLGACAVSHFGENLLPAAVSQPAVAICLNSLVLVSLPDGEALSVPPEELTNSEPCKENKERKTRKQKKTVETIAPTPVPVTDEQASAPIALEPTPAAEQALELTIDPQLDFDFFVFVCSNGSVFKVGSLCLVDSCCSPFLITHLFKSSLHGGIFVTAARCQCEGEKIVSVLQKFQVTVDGSFVSCNSTEFLCQVCLVKSVMLSVLGIAVPVDASREILEMSIT